MTEANKGENASPIAEVSTETPSSKAETAETKTGETQPDDVGEYQSAISQGQLFSIIENGEEHSVILEL